MKKTIIKLVRKKEKCLIYYKIKVLNKQVKNNIDEQKIYSRTRNKYI